MSLKRDAFVAHVPRCWRPSDVVAANSREGPGTSCRTAPFRQIHTIYGGMVTTSCDSPCRDAEKANDIPLSPCRRLRPGDVPLTTLVVIIRNFSAAESEFMGPVGPLGPESPPVSAPFECPGGHLHSPRCGRSERFSGRFSAYSTHDLSNIAPDRIPRPHQGCVRTAAAGTGLPPKPPIPMVDADRRPGHRWRSGRGPSSQGSSTALRWSWRRRGTG